MLVLESRNVNYALPQGVTYIHQFGHPEKSRAGDVLRIHHPVATVYERPEEMVMLHPWRDANPFFSLVESVWMIAGRDALGDLTPYIANFGRFSDDGKTVPGAYGKRWRDWHSLNAVWGDHQELTGSWGDQLDWVVKRLRTDPTDRRVVIQMWDPYVDPERADAGGKDVPCNLAVLPYVVDGTLNITVTCRSNDMILGAYGANAAHFSFLLCYLAARVGLKVGRYTQVSNNMHAYVENAGDPQACWPVDWAGVDPYARGQVRPFGLFDGMHPDEDPMGWADDKRERIIKEDLAVFFAEGPQASITAARWPFLRRIVAPMALAHRHWKKGKGEDRFLGALEILAQLPPANDWRRAGQDWINRRYDKWQQKEKKA